MVSGLPHARYGLSTAAAKDETSIGRCRVRNGSIVPVRARARSGRWAARRDTPPGSGRGQLPQGVESGHCHRHAVAAIWWGKMVLKLRRDAIWIGLNALCAVAFLWWSSTQWIEPEFKDVPGASGGGPLVFSFIVLFLLGPLLAVDLLWTALALRRWVRSGDWASLLVISVIGAAWVCLVLFSASRL